MVLPPVVVVSPPACVVVVLVGQAQVVVVLPPSGVVVVLPAGVVVVLVVPQPSVAMLHRLVVALQVQRHFPLQGPAPGVVLVLVVVGGVRPATSISHFPFPTVPAGGISNVARQTVPSGTHSPRIFFTVAWKQLSRSSQVTPLVPTS